MEESTIQEIQTLIKKSEAILISAGSGMGVDSGLPDFRGNEGFWKAYPPIAKLGYSFSQMANPKWFEENPSLAWAFYGHRLNLYRETIPHDGFKMLLNLVKEKKNYFVFTSNVDGQFQKSGFDSEKIVECHGSIHHLQCSRNCTNETWENDEIIEVDMETFEASNIPLCPKCGEVARPNILMFGDWYWNAKRTDHQEYLYYTWRKRNHTKNTVIIELGAGTAIQTVRLEGENIARRNKNAKVIRINPREPQINPPIGFGLEMGALEGLKKILV